MAQTVKYTINFMEATEEDLHRSADTTNNLVLIFLFCNWLLIFSAQRCGGKVACQYD